MEENNITPSFDKFKGDIMRIYPEGNLQETYDRLLFYIKDICDKDGNPLTYDFLLGKYEMFIKRWNYLYKRKEESGFLPKEATKERKNLYDFLGDKLYENEYNIQKGSLERDTYLFGLFSIPYLEKQLEAFKSIFKR